MTEDAYEGQATTALIYVFALPQIIPYICFPFILFF